MWYLDRHRMNCGSNVLAEFKLQRNPRGDKIRYQYKCCRRACRLKLTKSPFRTDMGGSGYALTQLYAWCGYGFINDIRVQRNQAGNQLRYLYYCSLAGRRHCYYRSTRASLTGHGNIIYLDRQRVGCARGYALSYYSLRRSSRWWYYRYRCCKI